MNEQSNAQQAVNAALTEDELSSIVGGGDTGPGSPGDNNGAVDDQMKATPILF